MSGGGGEEGQGGRGGTKCQNKKQSLAECLLQAVNPIEVLQSFSTLAVFACFL